MSDVGAKIAASKSGQSRIPKFRAVSPTRQNGSGGETGNNRLSTEREVVRKRKPHQQSTPATRPVVARRSPAGDGDCNGSFGRKPLQEEDEDVAASRERRGRRQWRSFDLGPPPPALDGDVQLPAWEARSAAAATAAAEVVGEAGRRQHNRTVHGDECFRQLKEDLAQEGTKESLLKMADDLLFGLDLRDTCDASEETRYRLEQATFWLIKSAERGSGEAWGRLKAMASRGQGVTAGNAAELEAAVGATTLEEVVGARIGRKAFALCADRNNNSTRGVERGGVSLCDLAERCAGEERATERTRWSRADRLRLSEMEDAGRAFMVGALPSKLDARLREYEVRTRANTLLITLVLWLNLLITSMVRGLVSAISLPSVQVSVILIAYTWISTSNQATTVFVIVAWQSLPGVVAMHSVASSSASALLRHRFRRWDRLFAETATDQERSQAKKHHQERESENATLNLAVLALCVGMKAFSLTWICPLAAAGTIWTLAHGRKAVLFFISLLYLGLEHAEWITLQTGIAPAEAIRASLHDLPSDIILLTASFLVAALLYGLRGGCESMCAAVIIMQHHISDLTLLRVGLTMALIGVMLVLLKHLVFRKRLLWSFLAVAILLSSEMVFVDDVKGLPISAPASTVSWKQFSAECRAENPAPTLQAECWERHRNSRVAAWEGRVLAITVKPNRPNEVAEFLRARVRDAAEQVLLPWTDQSSLDAACDDPWWTQQLFCQLLVGKRQHECTVRVAMGSPSLFSKGSAEVEASLGKQLWETCVALREGQTIELSGLIEEIFPPAIRVSDITVLTSE